MVIDQLSTTPKSMSIPSIYGSNVNQIDFYECEKVDEVKSDHIYSREQEIERLDKFVKDFKASQHTNINIEMDFALGKLHQGIETLTPGSKNKNMLHKVDLKLSQIKMGYAEIIEELLSADHGDYDQVKLDYNSMLDDYTSVQARVTAETVVDTSLPDALAQLYTNMLIISETLELIQKKRDRDRQNGIGEMMLRSVQAQERSVQAQERLAEALVARNSCSCNVQ
jgi:hypothetical protein